MSSLLAVDLGIRTGLALYEKDHGLRWYRSHNYGTSARLKRGARSLLGTLTGMEYIVLEGGGLIADIWQKEAAKAGIQVLLTGAEAWRQTLLYPRQQRTGTQAKLSAGELARRVIKMSNAPSPTSLRHDTAEAVLIGLWGMMQVGWLDEMPAKLR